MIGNEKLDELVSQTHAALDKCDGEVSIVYELKLSAFVTLGFDADDRRTRSQLMAALYNNLLQQISDAPFCFQDYLDDASINEVRED